MGDHRTGAGATAGEQPAAAAAGASWSPPTLQRDKGTDFNPGVEDLFQRVFHRSPPVLYPRNHKDGSPDPTT